MESLVEVSLQRTETYMPAAAMRLLPEPSISNFVHEERTTIIAASDYSLQSPARQRSFRDPVGKHYPNRIAIADAED